MPQMPKSSANAKISESDVGQGMAEASPQKTGRYRGAIGILLLALFTYGVSLIATAPANVLTRLVNMPAAVTSVSGSIWRGQAMLAGGHATQWSVGPLASFRHAALAIRWSLQGPGTHLQGNASLRPGMVSVKDVEGRISWQLVDAIAPGLPITCEAQARVAIERLVFKDTIEDMAGELRSGPSVCASVNGKPAQTGEVPSLLAIAKMTPDGSQLEITTVADEATPLARATLTAQDTLVLTLLSAGAGLVPGMPSSGETTLEFPL